MSDAASYGVTRTPDTLLGPQPHWTAVLEPPGVPGEPMAAIDPMAGDMPASQLPPEPTRIAIRLDEVTKVYPNGKHAVEDIDLVVPEGGFVFLVGPSGAGKSTLIKLLVRDDDPRVVDEGPGDRRPLLLAARELVRQLLRLPGQPDERDDALHRRPDLAPRRTGDLERERDVLVHGLARQQLEVLEHDPDLAPDLRHLAATDPGEVEAVDHHVAACRELIADEQLHQRRLARARRADEEHEVALGDDEIDVLEGLVAVRIALRDVVQHDDRMVRPGGPATAGEAVEQRRRGRG